MNTIWILISSFLSSNVSARPEETAMNSENIMSKLLGFDQHASMSHAVLQGQYFMLEMSWLKEVSISMSGTAMPPLALVVMLAER